LIFTEQQSISRNFTDVDNYGTTTSKNDSLQDNNTIPLKQTANNWSGYGWKVFNNWYETIGVGMAVLDGTIGNGNNWNVLDGRPGATIGLEHLGDIQIITTTETMLITPVEERSACKTITL
jgi:hypothetical protein